jgi:hypothetical protein
MGPERQSSDRETLASALWAESGPKVVGYQFVLFYAKCQVDTKPMWTNRKFTVGLECGPKALRIKREPTSRGVSGGSGNDDGIDPSFLSSWN